MQARDVIHALFKQIQNPNIAIDLQFFMDTGILAKQLKVYGILFKGTRDTWIDFRDMGITMLSEFWGYLPYLF